MFGRDIYRIARFTVSHHLAVRCFLNEAKVWPPRQVVQVERDAVLHEETAISNASWFGRILQRTVSVQRSRFLIRESSYKRSSNIGQSSNPYTLLNLKRSSALKGLRTLILRSFVNWFAGLDKSMDSRVIIQNLAVRRAPPPVPHENQFAPNSGHISILSKGRWKGLTGESDREHRSSSYPFGG